MARRNQARRTRRKSKPTKAIVIRADPYRRLITDISTFLDRARRNAARSVNAILTATSWQIGRRIVEHEQGGKDRAEYGDELLTRLASDLTARHGRGFSRQGLQRMRAFYLGWEITRSAPSSSNAPRTPKILPLSSNARPKPIPSTA
jgi:hypothetical protein